MHLDIIIPISLAPKTFLLLGSAQTNVPERKNYVKKTVLNKNEIHRHDIS